MQAIVIGGNIAAGKTTLAPEVARAIGAMYAPEPVEAWQASGMLQKFYAGDVTAYDFQRYVLETRSAALNPLLEAWRAAHDGRLPRYVVFDRWLDDDRMFAAANHALGRMTDAEMQAYDEQHARIKEAFDRHFVTTKIVWLGTAPAVCLERLRGRARAEEATITLGYLETLDRFRPPHIHLLVDTATHTEPAVTLNKVLAYINTRWRATAVVATANGGAIGRDDRLPWHAPEDLAFFRHVTRNKIVVMGRRTYDSLPAGGLPDRTVLVLSTSGRPGTFTWDELEAKYALDGDYVIAGGAATYEEAFRRNVVGRVIRTALPIDVPDADRFFAAPASFRTEQMRIEYLTMDAR